MGEVVPPILCFTAEEIERLRTLGPFTWEAMTALAASHEALRAELVVVRQALTDLVAVEDSVLMRNVDYDEYVARRVAASDRARAVLQEGAGRG